MPNLKKHRGAAKRFKKTGSGKIVRASAFKRHILTSKTTKSKRQMRGTREVADQDAPKLRLMPLWGRASALPGHAGAKAPAHKSQIACVTGSRRSR